MPAVADNCRTNRYRNVCLRVREIAIHYNGVGIIREPTAEEMEEYFQKHISKKSFLKEKTA